MMMPAIRTRTFMEVRYRTPVRGTPVGETLDRTVGPSCADQVHEFLSSGGAILVDSKINVKAARRTSQEVILNVSCTILYVDTYDFLHTHFGS